MEYKIIKKLAGSILFIGFVACMFSSCARFDEINTDPKSVSFDQVQPEYLINSSIIGAQQNPHIAERVFVLYWKTAGRQHRNNGLSTGTYDDGWSSDFYGVSYYGKWAANINSAVEKAQSDIASGTQQRYTNNLLQIARIWRAYLFSELAANFGPITLNGFGGTNPSYNSEKEVYYFILSELAEATASLQDGIILTDNLKKLDPAYSYDAAAWRRFGNSLRLRLSMRIAEVDPDKARLEFEQAAAGSFITTQEETFDVAERSGWDDLSGVMSREWNTQLLSATLNNLMLGLGGIKSENQLPDSLRSRIRPADYIGQRYADHWTVLTNDPSAGYWLDGLPHVIDPRAYKLFIIPGQFSNPDFSLYPSYTDDAKTTSRNLLAADGTTVIKTIEGRLTWNAAALGDWGAKGAANQVYSYIGTNPRLAQRYRNSANSRVFFGPWESYFLLAEAAVKGWAAPLTAQEAYERGIDLSFAYNGVSSFVSAYKNSDSYNRAGTSVRWGHTAEPPASYTMNYTDGYNGTSGTTTLMYPKNHLYKDGNIKNDHLTKILTQKFIAQTPWLPLETWNDHRRLGLPFFENPAIEVPIQNLPALTSANYMTSDVRFFPQRLPYPSIFRNNSAAAYVQAVGLLGAKDEVLTPLWWAKR